LMAVARTASDRGAETRRVAFIVVVGRFVRTAFDTSANESGRSETHRDTVQC
jgi:hypothetical protein